MAKKDTEKKTESKDISVDIAKKFGFTLVNDSQYSHVNDRIPTFIPQIDKIMGGGIPLQRITEVFSPAGVGKSTFMIELTKACSKLSVPTYYIDGEGTADRDRFAELGVDPSHTYVASTKGDADMTIEYAGGLLLDVVEAYRGKSDPLVIIFDSIGGIPTQIELDNPLDKEIQRGRKAAAVTDLVTKLTPLVKKTNVAVIFINQVRANQNMMNKYDKKYTRPGGNALDFSDSLRLELRKGTKIKNDDKIEIGNTMHVLIDKSKVSRPNRRDDTWIFSRPEFTTSKLTYGDFPDFPKPYDRKDTDKINFYIDGIDYEYNLYAYALSNDIIVTGGGYRKLVDPDTGEDIASYYENDFLFLLKQNYNGLRTKLFKYVLTSLFPTNFPPLDNKNVDISSWPDMAGIKEYYDSKNKNGE